MITISDGILTIPEGERFVGYTGDNLHTQKKFFIRHNTESGWIYRLYLTFDDGRHNFFILPATVGSEGTWLTWDITESHILKSGIVKAQIKAFSDDEEVYHTTSDVFFAGKATEEDDEFKNGNSEFLLYEKTLNDLYSKMQTASAKMPYVGTNGNWFTYDAKSEAYVDSGINSLVGIADGALTPKMLDRPYWEKKHYSVGISSYDSLFSSIKPIDDGGSICCANLDIITGEGRISGYCVVFGITESTGDIRMYITNVSDGSFWTILKFKDAQQYTAAKLSDGSYLKKCYTDLGKEITTFSELFNKVGFISTGGTVAIVKLLVSSSDADEVQGAEALEGEFLAVGSPNHTSGIIYLRNLANGEHWTVQKQSDGTYIAAKITAEISYNYVTPQMYGAVADGVNDDTASIQDAVNSGKEVFIPEGTYRITSSVKVSDKCKITGTLNTLILGTSDISGFVIEKDADNICIENLTISGCNFALDVAGFNCVFRDLILTNSAVGCYIREEAYANCFNNCSFKYNNIGIEGRIIYTSDFTDCRIYRNTTYGIKANFRVVTITGGYVEENGAVKVSGVLTPKAGTAGIYIPDDESYPTGQLTFVGVDFESNGECAILQENQGRALNVSFIGGQLAVIDHEITKAAIWFNVFDKVQRWLFYGTKFPESATLAGKQIAGHAEGTWADLNKKPTQIYTNRRFDSSNLNIISYATVDGTIADSFFVTDAERESWNNKSDFSGSYSDLTDTPDIESSVQNALTEAKESGEFDGPQGEKGEQGDKGADGYTPVKGTDYWTDADKAEMVSYVLSALPSWNGGSY